MKNSLTDYHAKIVIMATSGSISMNDAYNMLDTCKNEEIFELLSLNMNLDIYENSPEHLRLIELSEKYETFSAIHYEVF